MLTLELPAAPATVGATVAGQVTWTPSGDATLRALFIDVGWRTEGRGETDTGRIHELSAAPAAGQERAPFSGPVRFTIPANGPISYDGTLLRIVWSVTARADLAGGRDETTEQVFRVQPRVVAPTP